jgi:hypothetical protein
VSRCPSVVLGLPGSLSSIARASDQISLGWSAVSSGRLFHRFSLFLSHSNTYNILLTTRVASCLLTCATAIVVGLLVMMWPILTKVQYEKLPQIFSTKKMWFQIGISLVLNWIVGPVVMLGVAWATLPDLPTYRTGVIMVGLARCIAVRPRVSSCSLLVLY